MEERAVPAVGRRARTPATFMVVDMSRACARVECRCVDGHERLLGVVGRVDVSRDERLTLLICSCMSYS